MAERRREFCTSQGVTAPPTTSQASTSSDPMPTEEDDVCSVCLDPLSFTGPGKKPETVTLGCGHQLHVACFVPCMVREQTDDRRDSLLQRCPLCRRSFTRNLKNALTDCYRRPTQDDLQPYPRLLRSLSTGSDDYELFVDGRYVRYVETIHEQSRDHGFYPVQNGTFESFQHAFMVGSDLITEPVSAAARPHNDTPRPRQRPLSGILQAVRIPDEEEGSRRWVTVEQITNNSNSHGHSQQTQRVEAIAPATDMSAILEANPDSATHSRTISIRIPSASYQERHASRSPVRLLSPMRNHFEMDTGSFTIGSLDDSHRGRRNNQHHRARQNHGNS